MNNTSKLLEKYVQTFPQDILEEIKWLSIKPADMTEKEFYYSNTLAVLKLFGYVKYQENHASKSFNKICEVLEKEFVYQNISLKQKEIIHLRQVVAETLAKIIVVDMSASSDVSNIRFLVVIKQQVERLKKIPKTGLRYHEIITACYLQDTYNLNVEELIQYLGMSRTNFYRLKEKALMELSKIIWMDNV